ncbi:MAG: hsp70 family protein [Deltaproteobacteria bacterium]|nr:hsp70 family protein [Deltaproteobacteria bacterium]
MAIEVFPVPQLVSPGEAAALPLVPSSTYLPAEGELPPGGTRLPWGDEPPFLVGELARRQGAKVPGRVVTSAKSWLCHDRVDRSAPILPWGAPEGVPRVSPVEASARIVAHVRAAWDAAHPDALLADQDVTLTVPASFDAAARALTVDAARKAGLDRMRLLEEPQAAFYDFLRDHELDLEAALAGARLVLVVDVGGGTTDLTLVRVSPQPVGPPRLERLAVGEHLMLGGDNMDVTLARHVEGALLGESGRLDPSQWAALVHAARAAKEALLGEAAPDEVSVAVVGRGSKLFGGAQVHALRRVDAEQILLDGFLPRTGPADLPERGRRAALLELGLPFESEPAISRHVCSFLRRHVQGALGSGAVVVDGLVRPEAVLLNGGVFKGARLTARLCAVLAGWFRAPVPLLPHDSLDLAVARGAAYYGLVRRGLGLRIAGGSARAYYIGVETPGGVRQAFCVAPRGMEEGTEIEVKDRTFALKLGQPVSFPLYASTADRIDSAGDLVDVDQELGSLPPLATVLRAQDGSTAEVSVRLRAILTEIGTLEVYLSTTEGFRRRFRLEFSVREEKNVGGGAAVAPIDELPRRFDDARALVERCYGKSPQPVEPREVRFLHRQLEKAIGDRDGWSSAVNRELWNIVLRGAQKRRRSADHERVFFQLAGFCLRPGFGAPLDEWRIGELWKLCGQGVQYLNEKANWSEWWVMWRRVAGGLDRARQEALALAIRPSLKPKEGGWAAAKKPKAQGHDEMVRLVASLERLPAAEKADVARWIWTRLDDPTSATTLWPIGRIGARVPFYGSIHDVVGRDLAAGWVERILALDWTRVDGAAFAAAQLARVTGDRERDLDEPLREKVAARLAAGGASETWLRMVREVVELSAQDEMRVFGDTLPVGLKLAL